MKFNEVETLRGLFSYKGGYLYNRTHRHKSPRGREVNNTPNTEGYMHTEVGGKAYKVHRIIFAIENGYFPEVVDHANGETLDNRIENLRGCSKKENFHNMKKVKGLGISQVQGVSKYSGRWRVRLGVFGKRLSLGLYDDLELAEFVASEARDKYHGVFDINKREPLFN
tara:strand:- start:78 stop:581 length:504 start_codon:yes stop_codon:yes gene_type:complete